MSWTEDPWRPVEGRAPADPRPPGIERMGLDDGRRRVRRRGGPDRTRAPATSPAEGEADRAFACGSVGPLALDDDRLEVLARHDHRAVVGAVEPRDQVEHVGLERVSTGVADGLEGLERRAVEPRASTSTKACRRARRGRRSARFYGAELGDRVAEQLAQPRLGAPLDRRAQTRRRRDVRPDRLEQLADEALRRVGDEPDPAARAGRRARARSRSAPGPARTSPRRPSSRRRSCRPRTASASASPSTELDVRPSASARRRARSSRAGT